MAQHIFLITERQVEIHIHIVDLIYHIRWFTAQHIFIHHRTSQDSTRHHFSSWTLHLTSLGRTNKGHIAWTLIDSSHIWFHRPSFELLYQPYYYLEVYLHWLYPVLYFQTALEWHILLTTAHNNSVLYDFLCSYWNLSSVTCRAVVHINSIIP